MIYHYSVLLIVLYTVLSLFLFAINAKLLWFHVNCLQSFICLSYEVKLKEWFRLKSVQLDSCNECLNICQLSHVRLLL